MISSLGEHTAQALAGAGVDVDRSRCSRHRFARSACRNCTTVCPTGAVRWTEEGLSVDAKSCTLCLLCTASCPTGALRGGDVRLATCINDLAAHEQPVLGCRKHGGDAAHVRLPCLGALASPKALLLLDLLFPDGLQINLSHCRDCENAAVPAAIETVGTALAVAGCSSRLRFVTEKADLEFSLPTLSRREFFTFFKERSVRSARGVIDRILESAEDKSYGDKNLPELHELLKRTINRMSETPLALAAARLTTPKVVMSEKCSGCTGCVGICPTDALVPAEADRAPPLFVSDYCVDCGLCANFCRRAAIELTSPAA